MPDGRTVLIVEDDHQWQAILRETLEDEGYSVTAIGDYHNGRQALKQACFDLVILDLELDRSSPMFEGRRLLDLISRHYSDTPCIIVSGKGDTQMVRDAFKRYQVVDYIIKDHFDIPTFIHAVQSALTPGASPVTLRQLLNGSDLFDPNDESVQAIPEYEQILMIVQYMGEVMERSPHAFAEMNEEDLRQHFLVQLNGRYAGQATGETFNYNGKTDILIRVNGKNVFIAECKFWRGPKGLLDTVDQLLSYANWRDTKTAILLFNRSTTFSHILSRIPEIIESHLCFKHKTAVEKETVFRYVFHRPDDVDRELLLTVMAFDIPR